MKGRILIIFTLIFLLNTAFMQDKTKKIQEELIKTIQTEYVNWLIEKNSSPSMTDSFPSAVTDSTTNLHNHNLNNKHTPPQHPEIHCNFYDFEFKITNSQAVVQFKVNNLIKSAFLEKKDGKWQLICCADIAPVL